MRWLLVGALLAETLPVRQRLQGGRRLGRRLVTGRLGGVDVGVLRCGVGPRRALAHTREALEAFEAEAVVSFGTAGSLVDHLGVGAVVCTAGWDGVRRARCTTVRRGVFDPSRRAELAAQGFEVVEMEAAAVEEAAGPRAFYGLKVISDLASVPPTRFGFALHAWRICSDRLAPTLEKLVVEETSGRG